MISSYVETFCHNQGESAICILCSIGYIFMGCLNAEKGVNVELDEAIEMLKRIVNFNANDQVDDHHYVNRICELLNAHEGPLLLNDEKKLLLEVEAKEVTSYISAMSAVSRGLGLVAIVDPVFIHASHGYIDLRDGQAVQIKDEPCEELEGDDYLDFTVIAGKRGMIPKVQLNEHKELTQFQTVVFDDAQLGFDIVNLNNIKPISDMMHAIAAKGIQAPDDRYPGQEHLVFKNSWGAKDREVHITSAQWKDPDNVKKAFTIKFTIADAAE